MKDGFSIVTATRGNGPKLLRLWETLQNQTFAAWEWIVVAPGPPPKFWHTDARAQWITVDNCGVNAARNKGAKLATHSVLLFLDDDVFLPTTHHLERRFTAHLQSSALTVLGGGYHSTSQCGFWDRAYNTLCNLWLRRFQISGRGEMLLGGNFSMRTALWEKYKLMEEACWGGEETRSFLTWKNCGVHFDWKRNLYVNHHPQKDGLDFFKTAWRQGRGKFHSGDDCDFKTLLALILAAGWWLPVLGCYWLVVEASRRLTAREKTKTPPASGRLSDTFPAKSTSK